MKRLGWFGGGVVLWSILEYSLHRFVGHVWDTTLRARHLRHHAQPDDGGFDPTWTIVGLGLIAAGARIAEEPALVAGGCVGGYLAYEVAHERAHRRPREHMGHVVHHATLDTNFGVTTQIWDRVFGTTHRTG